MPPGAPLPDEATLVARLRSATCYPHPVAAVEVLETHISWVLLAGDFAYKIKKPVNLGFVDFSTLAARRRFCEEEIRLNRRTATALYLDVVPVSQAPGGLAMGGDGPAIEYAVRMRRFPQEALLNAMARRGALTARHVDDLAAAMAEFHGGVAAQRGEGPFGSPAEVLDEASGNFTQLAQIDAGADTPAARESLRAWTHAEFALHEAAFAHRKFAGFVRECHGDLHLGNVALIDARPVAFDAIEFNEGFRWIDVMNEVAFPVMDLHHHQLPRLAHRLLDAYLSATGDYAGLRVLRFYAVYRAMVRAKVACIRAHQGGAAAAQREASARAYRGHLALAERLSRPAPAALVAMHGLSGSGKTTVSQRLLEALGAVRLRSDVERKRLHGLAAQARTGSAPGGGLYTAADDRLTYERLAALADECLAAGWPVIVDATFLERRWRELFRDYARERAVPFVLLACAAPEETLRGRVAARERGAADASEAGIAVLERQITRLEPLDCDELESAVILDTERALTEQEIDRVARRIATRVL
jgi:aminoglycoside phosphotransferase family enzyme/predicted kinase